jgi:hypothetical protein
LELSGDAGSLRCGSVPLLFVFFLWNLFCCYCRCTLHRVVVVVTHGTAHVMTGSEGKVGISSGGHIEQGGSPVGFLGHLQM